MDKELVLRENLEALLTGEYARMSFDDAVKDFPMSRINDDMPNSDRSPWHLLEHLRLAQEDILDFIKNPNYQDKSWPEGFWPPIGKKATPADWRKSVADFRRDFGELIAMVKDPRTDLYREIPYHQGPITFLREIVTVASHTGFHLGEFAIMRQAMGTWGRGRRV